MCNFFSFCTEPEKHGGKRYYFDWKQRTSLKLGDYDTHSGICKHYGLDEDICNKYEYNPLSGKLVVDQINSDVDDRVQAEEWVRSLDWKRVVEPLIIKPIVNPFDLDAPPVGEEQIELLRKWASVWDSVLWDSVRTSVGDSVWVSVRTSVRASVGAIVWDSVRTSGWASVGVSVRAYSGSFFDLEYAIDISSDVTLWEQGFVPSFDGTTWRLHAGKDARVVFAMECE